MAVDTNDKAIKQDGTSDLLKQLQFASEYKSNFQDTLDRGRKRHVYFHAGKTELVFWDRSNDRVVATKMDGCALAEKLHRGSLTASIANNAP